MKTSLLLTLSLLPVCTHVHGVPTPNRPSDSNPTLTSATTTHQNVAHRLNTDSAAPTTDIPTHDAVHIKPDILSSKQRDPSSGNGQGSGGNQGSRENSGSTAPGDPGDPEPSPEPSPQMYATPEPMYSPQGEMEHGGWSNGYPDPSYPYYNYNDPYHPYRHSHGDYHYNYGVYPEPSYSPNAQDPFTQYDDHYHYNDHSYFDPYRGTYDGHYYDSPDPHVDDRRYYYNDYAYNDDSHMPGRKAGLRSVAACGHRADRYKSEMIESPKTKIGKYMQSYFGQKYLCYGSMTTFKTRALPVPPVCPPGFSRSGDMCVRDGIRCKQFNHRKNIVSVLKFKTMCTRDLTCQDGNELFKGKCYSPCPYGFYRIENGSGSGCAKSFYYQPLCPDSDIVDGRCTKFVPKEAHRGRGRGRDRFGGYSYQSHHN